MAVINQYAIVRYTDRHNASFSDSAGNLAAAKATGACVGMLRSPVHDNLNALYVGLPGTVGTSVRVADGNAEDNTLIAKIAFCHFFAAPPRINCNYLQKTACI